MGSEGICFKEFKFKEERNRKPLYTIPFRAGASPWVPSQLTQSLTPRAARPIHTPKSKLWHPKKSHRGREDWFHPPGLSIPMHPSEARKGTMTSSLSLRLPHSSFPNGTVQIGATPAASQPMPAKSPDRESALALSAHPITARLNGTGALTFQPLSGNSIAFRFLRVALKITLGEKAYQPQKLN